MPRLPWVSVLNVVEPHSAGIGGDTFALIYLAQEDRLIGMNGSGRAPYRANIDFFASRGMKEIPDKGIYPVTVPGALHSWAEALERYGTMTLADVFEDAIYYAEEGFPVTEVIAGEWKHMAHVLRSNDAAARTFLVNGEAPAPGDRFRNPDLGRILRTIARDGAGPFTKARSATRSFAVRKIWAAFFPKKTSRPTPPPGSSPYHPTTEDSRSTNCRPTARGSRPSRC